MSNREKLLLAIRFLASLGFAVDVVISLYTVEKRGWVVTGFQVVVFAVVSRSFLKAALAQLAAATAAKQRELARAYARGWHDHYLEHEHQRQVPGYPIGTERNSSYLNPFGPYSG